MQTFLFIISWLLFGLATAYFAKQRGRDPRIWFLVGTFFGILGLLLVFVLPSVDTQNEPEMKELLPEPPEALPQLPHHDYALKDWYYYDNQRQRIGPVSFEQLKTHFVNGALTPESFVWSEGQADWNPLKDIPDLLEHLR